MRLKVLFNPTAGRGRAKRHIAEVVERLQRGGAEVECMMSASPQHLTALAAEASRSPSVDRVVVCGGDGTLNLAVREFDLERGSIAIVPLGSGDDFAQTLGIPRDADGACKAILSGTTREVDVATVNAVRFLGVAGLGFDSEVAQRAQEVRYLRGSLVYLYSILRVLPRFRPHEVTIAVDGRSTEETIMFAAIGNSHRYGAGIAIVPDARPDDGLLDLCVVHRCSRLDLLRTLPRAYTGGHITSPFVSVDRGTRVELASARPMKIYADGECLAETPATIAIEPQRLRIAVPA